MILFDVLRLLYIVHGAVEYSTLQFMRFLVMRMLLTGGCATTAEQLLKSINCMYCTLMRLVSVVHAFIY